MNQNEIEMQQENMRMQQQMNQMQSQMNQMNQAMTYRDLPEKMESFEHGVIVKQKFDLLQVLTGCEIANQYYVYRRDHEGKMKGEKEFKYSEKSTCYERMCMTGSCKPYRMKCFNNQKIADGEYCMRCQKDCKCTYYCCNRQQMVCWRSENGKESYLGKIYDPWNFCNFTFELYDDTGHDSCSGGSSNLGKLDYSIEGNCCQCYFWCNCPCDSCQKVEFEILDPSRHIVGQVMKIGKGCMTNMLTGNDMDIFSVDFPKGSNWRQRAMLMNFAVFVDYIMFEETSKEQNKQF